MSDWETLGAVDPRHLIDARVQMHWAAQAAAAVGKLLGAPQSDFSQQSFQWVESARCLAQAPIVGKATFRSAIRFDHPALVFLDESSLSLHEFLLHGRTLDEAYAWVGETAEKLLGSPLPGELERGADLPPHPVAEGGAFEIRSPASFSELGRYFGGTHRLLTALSQARPNTTPVRCWPHHFDIATLLQLDGPGEGEASRSIGVGLSPGDGSYSEPYFYVTPWPYPAEPELKALPSGGRWHREDWLGAVLLGESLVATSSNGSQRRRIQEFLDKAIESCQKLLASGS